MKIIKFSFSSKQIVLWSPFVNRFHTIVTHPDYPTYPLNQGTGHPTSRHQDVVGPHLLIRPILLNPRNKESRRKIGRFTLNLLTEVPCPFFFIFFTNRVHSHMDLPSQLPIVYDIDTVSWGADSTSFLDLTFPQVGSGTGVRVWVVGFVLTTGQTRRPRSTHLFPHPLYGRL